MTNRLKYIDTLKGLCILLVLIDHSGFILHPILDYIEVPSFFLLSGFLYKEQSFFKLLNNKITKLIIPYFLFSILFIIPFLCTKDISISISSIIFFFLLPANEPLWFLKTLFWAFLIYKLLDLLFSKFTMYNLGKIVFLFTIILGAFFAKKHAFTNNLFIISCIPQALIALPLFMFGNIIRKYNFIETYYKTGKFRFLLLLPLICLWVFHAKSNLSLHIAQYNESIIEFYISSICAFLSLLFIFSEFNQKYILPWLGRNSIHILGLHFSIITLLYYFNINNNFIILVTTTTVLIPLTYISKKFLPSI